MHRVIYIMVCLLSYSVFSQQVKRHAVPVIFDTDIAEDYDDVGALTLLHAFADKGEAKILATISSNSFETTVPTISVINTYFGRQAIPIGVTKRTQPNRPCKQGWAQAIIQKYPHRFTSNNDAREAVSLYREILSKQPDTSVTIITVGFFTNIADLLASAPDKFSPLNGRDLVNKKVKQLVSMAARLDSGKNKGSEYNVHIDTKASQKVFSEWDRPFILSPFEIGQHIFTGIPLTHDKKIWNSPVKDAYKIALEKDKNDIGRMSWDQTAVLVAVRGFNPFFTYRKLNLKIEDDGSDTLVAGTKLFYLEFKTDPHEVQVAIEKLMHHQPVKMPH